MKHVYDWIAEPTTSMAELAAKEWLDQFCRPAIDKDREWLERYRVTVKWRGKRYECTGASRLGDVWLKNKGSQNYYDHRVDVDECSNWKRIQNPIKS